MATSPMQASPEAAPAAPATTPEAETSADAGYCVCLCVKADGSMMVGTKPMGPAMPMDGMKPVGNIREGVETIMEIFKGNGEMPSGEDDSDFASGFGKAAPPVTQKVRDVEDMA